MNTSSLLNVIDKLDFYRAFRRVKYDSEYDFIQMPVEITIFEEYLDKNIEFLLSSIKGNDYSVKSLKKIWVPKKNFFLRPGSVPHLDDRILFQALIDNIATILENQLPTFEDGVVFSSRLNTDQSSERLFRHPRELWISFQKKALEYCQTPGIGYVLVSDIASYFENIDLRLLVDTLDSLDVNPGYVDGIRQMLSSWADGRTRGLPQMIAPCSLLANTYLSQVDTAMLRRGYNYIRYVDDIRIFVKSKADLKAALYDLTEQLKNCYLDVQASKTKFLTVQEHADELTLLDRNLARVGIELEVTLSDQEGESNEIVSHIPEVKLLAFLNQLLENPHYDDRHLRFCLNRLRSPAAKELVLSKFGDMPQETGTFVQYLLKLAPGEMNENDIQRVIDFLDSVDNIYDWQMMWLLIFLCRVHTFITKKQLSQLFRNGNLQRHSVNRALLSYLLCRRGDLTLKREFTNKYGQEPAREVQIAILCGVYGLDAKERNRFYAGASKDRQLTQLISMLKNKEVHLVKSVPKMRDYGQ